MKTVAILTALALGSAATVVMAADGSRGDRGAMLERLKAADTNGDGMISRDEAKALPRILKSFDAIDANRDGQVTMEELHAFHQANRGAHRGGFVSRLDTDKDGRISREEANAAPRFAEHFDAIDANHDGFVTPDELKAAHAKHRAQANVEPK
jgi:Ca2+-binding EF-hand superfamily protein